MTEVEENCPGLFEVFSRNFLGVTEKIYGKHL